MHVTWIGGWGVAPESLRPVAERYFPESKHTFLAPSADCIRKVMECGGPPPLSETPSTPQKRQRAAALHDAGADVFVAWSLGAWRVLEAASRGVEFPGMVLLLAPFVAFPSESLLGGKCSATQVKVLKRWLQREPLAAVADFYQRAGLLGRSAAVPAAAGSAATNVLEESGGRPAGGIAAAGTAALRPVTELPYALPDLLEGLDRLAEDASPALRAFAARGLPRNWQALIGDDDLLLDAETVRRSLPGCVRVRGAGHAIAELLRASQA